MVNLFQRGFLLNADLCTRGIVHHSSAKGGLRREVEGGLRSSLPGRGGGRRVEGGLEGGFEKGGLFKGASRDF